MKNLILFTAILTHGYMCSFSPAYSKACKNHISKSEAIKAVNGEAAKPGCKKEEKCFCYDGINFKDAEIKMSTRDIKDKPIYEYVDLKERQSFESGLGPVLKPELYCEEGFKRHKDRCRKLVGYEQTEPSEMLVNSQSKRQARLQKEAAEKPSKEAQKRDKEKLMETIEVIADELGRDDQGRFLSRDQIRQKVKALKPKK